MSKFKKITGTIVGFSPMNLKSMPDIHKIMRFKRTNQQLALEVKPFDSRFTVQAYIPYRTALALAEYLSHTHIPLKKSTLVTLNYHESHDRDVISKITRIGSHTFSGIQDARHYAKKRGGSTALSVNSALSARASATANDFNSKPVSRAFSSSSSRVESTSSSYSLNDSVAPKINSTVTSQLSNVAQYKGLTSSSNDYAQTSKAYKSLMSVSGDSMNSGLGEAYKKEHWSGFMTSLTTYAGKDFKEDVNANVNKAEFSYAMGYNRIPTDFKPTTKHKQRQHRFSGDSIHIF